jgi:hypothetical protein
MKYWIMKKCLRQPILESRAVRSIIRLFRPLRIKKSTLPIGPLYYRAEISASDGKYLEVVASNCINIDTVFSSLSNSVLHDIFFIYIRAKHIIFFTD